MFVTTSKAAAHRLARCAALIGLVASAAGAAQAAGRPAAYLPADANEVVERVPASYAAVIPQSPGEPSFGRATKALALAARHGDSRLAARAERELQALARSRPSPEVDRALAWAAQHRHDFANATALLDRAIAADPRDVSARVMRVQIEIVQGRLDSARRQCGELTLLDVTSSLACTAAIATRAHQSDRALAALDRLVAASGHRDDESMRALLVARADARIAIADADADFERALALAPDDVRTRAAYARHLRATARPASVLRMLSGDELPEGLSLERALAAKAVGDPRWILWADELDATYAHIRAVGAVPELRDEAAFRLYVRGDAPGALRLARENWAEQRDVEDEAILREAAIATRNLEVLREVAAWRAAQGIGAQFADRSTGLDGDAPVTPRDAR